MTIRWLTSATSLAWCALKTMRDACRQTSRPQGAENTAATGCAGSPHRRGCRCAGAGRRASHTPATPPERAPAGRHYNLSPDSVSIQPAAGRLASRHGRQAPITSMYKGHSHGALQPGLRCSMMPTHESALRHDTTCVPYLDELCVLCDAPPLQVHRIPPQEALRRVVPVPRLRVADQPQGAACRAHLRSHVMNLTICRTASFGPAPGWLL